MKDEIYFGYLTHCKAETFLEVHKDTIDKIIVGPDAWLTDEVKERINAGCTAIQQQWSLTQSYLTEDKMKESGQSAIDNLSTLESYVCSLRRLIIDEVNRNRYQLKGAMVRALESVKALEGMENVRVGGAYINCEGRTSPILSLMVMIPDVVLEHEGVKYEIGNVCIYLEFRVVTNGGNLYSIKVVKEHSDLNKHGYAHPHVSSGTGVCLGGFGTAIKHFVRDLDFVSVVGALNAWALAYDPKDSYCNIRAWAKPLCFKCKKEMAKDEKTVKWADGSVYCLECGKEVEGCEVCMVRVPDPREIQNVKVCQHCVDSLQVKIIERVTEDENN